MLVRAALLWIGIVPDELEERRRDERLVTRELAQRVVHGFTLGLHAREKVGRTATREAPRLRVSVLHDASHSALSLLVQPVIKKRCEECVDKRRVEVDGITGMEQCALLRSQLHDVEQQLAAARLIFWYKVECRGELRPQILQLLQCHVAAHRHLGLLVGRLGVGGRRCHLKALGGWLAALAALSSRGGLLVIFLHLVQRPLSRLSRIPTVWQCAEQREGGDPAPGHLFTQAWKQTSGGRLGRERGLDDSLNLLANLPQRRGAASDCTDARDGRLDAEPIAVLPALGAQPAQLRLGSGGKVGGG